MRAKGYRRKGQKKRFGRRKYKSRVGRSAYIMKRGGMPIRIGNNDTAPYQPIAVADGVGSLSVGSYVADVLNTYQFGASIQFKLESSVQAADIIGMFDRYKIIGVKLRCLYQCNVAAAGAATGSILPVINYAFDADDVVVPTLITDVTRKQYCKTKVMNANKPFNIWIKPRQLLQSSLPGADITVRPLWNNCANADIPHYGLKMFISNWQADPGLTGSAELHQLTIQPTYYFALKDTQ